MIDKGTCCEPVEDVQKISDSSAVQQILHEEVETSTRMYGHAPSDAELSAAREATRLRLVDTCNIFVRFI